MKKTLFPFALLFLLGSVTACSTWFDPYENMEMAPEQAHRAQADGTKYPNAGQGNSLEGTQLAMGPSVGGNIANTMDSQDKMKLTRALDNAPGKSTHWENANTGTSYTVVPTQKMTINENPYCRKYNVTSIRSGKERQYIGTACVTADGTWQPVNES